jgi:hypothetical protein
MLEEANGLYSIFDKEIVLGISSNLAIRPDARNISSMHTSRQVGPDIRYKIPSLEVITFDFFELNLTQIYTSAFNSTNIKGSSNHRGFEMGAR